VEALGSGCVTENLIGAHRDLIRRYGGNYSVISGHVHFGEGESLDPRYQYMTLMREPVDRVISWLFFVLTNHTSTQLPGLHDWSAEFVNSDGHHLDERLVPYISNLYTNHFSCVGHDSNVPSKEKIANAFSVIKQYAVVGLYDQMSLFLAAAADLIGLPKPREIARVNVTTQRPHAEQISHAMRERIVQLNQLDLQLYEEVQMWKAFCTQTSSLRVERDALPGWERYEPVMERVFATPELTVDQAVLREGYDIVHGQIMTFDVDFFLSQEVGDLEMGIHIFDGEKRWAFGINSTLLEQSHKDLSRGSYRISHHLLAELPEGKYTAGFAFAERLPDGNRELAWYDKLCEFQVCHQTDRKFAGYVCLPAEMTLSRRGGAIDLVAGNIMLCVPIATIFVDERVALNVNVLNKGSLAWKGDVFRPVSLSYHWLDTHGEMVVFDGERSPLPAEGILAGQALATSMTVLAPPSPGDYRLVLTLVQEGVSWFEDIGFEAASCAIVVEERR
jgi:hypothetical protein